MAMPQSHKQERGRIARSLRAQGRSWVEIASFFQQRYRVNPRLAFRWAHTWSQHEVAERWNARWPDQLKTFKNISYWELWPGGTGHAPSFDSLAKLAALYECSVGDLLADLANCRGNDPQATASHTGDADRGPREGDGTGTQLIAAVEAVRHQLPVLPIELSVNGAAVTLATSLSERLGTVPLDSSEVVQFIARELSWQLGHASYEQLTRCLRSWAEAMDRRDFLGALGWAATAAAVASPVDGLDADELVRLDRVVAGVHHLDVDAIAHIEAVLSAARRLDDALGPQAALDTVLAQRSVARLLLAGCSQRLLPQLLSTYSNLSSTAGWLYFDLNDFRSAWHHYQAARDAAHQVGDSDLSVYALSGMSRVAEWRGKRPLAVDLTAAAQRLTAQTGDIRLRAYVEGRSALVYAADRQADACLRALDRAEEHLADVHGDTSADSLVYFYDDEMLTYHKSKCHLQLDQPQKTLTITRQALASVDVTFTRDLAVAKLCLAKAYLAAGEADEGATVTAEVAELAMQNRSPRLARDLRATRAEMEPWSQRPTVKQLDDRLAAYGLG